LTWLRSAPNGLDTSIKLLLIGEFPVGQFGWVVYGFLMRNLRQRLAVRQIKLDEQYMVIIGRSTRRQSKLSILFRRHLLGNTGKDIEPSEDIVVSQKPKTLEKQSEG